MKEYQKIEKLGEGGQGIVFKAMHLKTERIVAVKRVFMASPKDGVSYNAIREIKVLQEIKHPNIVELLDVFHAKGDVHLVYEHLDFDLDQLIRDKSILLKPEHIKSYMKMLLDALSYCHSNWILHRDVKPSNLLMDSAGILKLADFGLARTFGSPNTKLSPQAVTRWYRPPELLFGSTQYGPAADIWGAGCILAELIQRSALFPGSSDLDQGWRIVQVLGSPTEATWPGVTGLADYIEFKEMPSTPWKLIFPAADPSCIQLLSKILVWDPMKRPSADQALVDDYFKQSPLPCDSSLLPKPRASEPQLYDNERLQQQPLENDITFMNQRYGDNDDDDDDDLMDGQVCDIQQQQQQLTESARKRKANETD